MPWLLSKVACTDDFFWFPLAGAIDQGQHQVAAFQQGLQSTSLHGACNEVGEPAPSAGAPGLARGVPASVPASPAMAATSAAMSSSKQTLEEMAAWLDAQLAAASGKLCCLCLSQNASRSCSRVTSRYAFMDVLICRAWSDS